MLQDCYFFALRGNEFPFMARKITAFSTLKLQPHNQTMHQNFEAVFMCGSTRQTLGTGTLAAHWQVRLVLLGSPPDTVHGRQLRKTHPSSCPHLARPHKHSPWKC